MRIRAVTNGRAQDEHAAGQRRACSEKIVRNLVLSLDGIWTRAPTWPPSSTWNQPLPNAAGNDALGPLPYPLFGTFIEYRQPRTASSNYKGIDVGLEKALLERLRLRRRLHLSDSKDNTSEHLATQGRDSFPQNAPLTSTRGTGRATTTSATAWPCNYVFELPFGSGKKWANSGAAAAILGDWTWSGIYAARTGRPFTVSQSSNNVGHQHVRPCRTVTRSTPFQDGGPVDDARRLQAVTVRDLQATTAQPVSRAAVAELRHEPASGRSASTPAVRRHPALGRLQPLQLRSTLACPDRNISLAGHFQAPSLAARVTRGSCSYPRASDF